MVFRQAQGYVLMARLEVLYVWIEFRELGLGRLSGLINWLWGLQRAAVIKSCAESSWSIIYTVDMMTDTVHGDECVFCTLYVQGKSVYLGRVCVTEYVCAHVFHSRLCLQYMLAKQPEDRHTSHPQGATFPVRRETVRQWAAHTPPSSFALNTSLHAHLHYASTVFGNTKQCKHNTLCSEC